jgi:hypothetical protein
MTDTPTTSTTRPRPPIETLEDLQNHLWEACFVEMSTVPLYLYSLYSIKSQIEGSPSGYVGDVNRSSSASASVSMSTFRLIRSVVVEEMLHLTLARNVLYSTGGTIQFYDPCFVPRFGVVDEPICTPPTSAPPGAPLQTQPAGQQYMLHRVPQLPFNLTPCTEDQVKNTFMALEAPAGAGGVAQSDWYNSIGQFYEAIEAGFHNVQNAIGEDNLFGNNRAANQLHSVASYWNQEGGGVPIGVTNLASVTLAVNQIISQGEGAGGSDLSPITFGDPARYVRNYEFSHYEKFTQVLEKIENIKADAAAAAKTESQQAQAAEQAWADKLWPLATNPRVADYEGDLQQLAVFCNAIYCYALLLIDANYTVALPDAVVNGVSPLPESVYDDPGMKEKWGLTQGLLTTMTGILFPVIDILVRQKAGPDSTVNAGPTFEFYAGFQALSTKEERKQHLLDLCDSLLPAYPALGGEDSVRQRIANMPAA